MAGKAEEILWYEFWKLGPDRNSSFDYLIAASFFFVCVPPPPSPRDASFFFFTLVTGPRRSLSLKLSDTRVYAPQIRARLGTTTHFCEVVVLKLTHARTHSLTGYITDWPAD